MVCIGKVKCGSIEGADSVIKNLTTHTVMSFPYIICRWFWKTSWTYIKCFSQTFSWFPVYRFINNVNIFLILQFLTYLSIRSKEQGSWSISHSHPLVTIAGLYIE